MKKYFFSILLIISVSAQAQVQPIKTYDDSALDKLGWKIAIQAWTFKLFTLDETLNKLNELGIKYIELYPKQLIGGGIEGTTNFDIDENKIQQLKNLLASKGIKAVSYGVVKAKTEADWIRIFEFADAMDIETIVAEPEAKFMGLIETLCDKHKINLGIHNHPKPTPYWHPDLVKPLFAARSNRIGISGDIGHWVRSGLDPLDCINQLEGRFVSLHLKDINQFGVKTAHDVPWGTGNCNIAGVLHKLKNIGYKGIFSVEYEYNWENSLPEVKESIDYFYRIAYWLNQE